MPRIYVLNLESRTDRKAHITGQFNDHPEFEVRVSRPAMHPHANVSLWLTLQAIVRYEKEHHTGYFIFCEDDHLFSKDYCFDFFTQCIRDARQLGAHILSGGVSWASGQVQISDHLFWLEKFSGLQFTVIFKNFYAKILYAPFSEADCADGTISALTDKKFLIYPMISVQKEFGYSDVTPKNNQKGRVEALFKRTELTLELHHKISVYYKKHKPAKPVDIPYDEVMLPVYVIHLPERTDRLAHIKEQFRGRDEFEVTVVEACKHEVGAYGLWLSIRKTIQLALDNHDDVVVICEDDHMFTGDYDRDILIQNIIEAYGQGADFMSGGAAKVGYPVPIAANRFWISYGLSSQFLIIFKRFFDPILRREFDEKTIADLLLARMTNNKMLLYPFISTQKDFGYSDVTALHNKKPGLITKMFDETSASLKRLNEAYIHYGSPRRYGETFRCEF